MNKCTSELSTIEDLPDIAAAIRDNGCTPSITWPEGKPALVVECEPKDGQNCDGCEL